MAGPRGLIGFVAYPGITALDLVGPFEVLARSGQPCLVVAASTELIETDRGLVLQPDVTMSVCPQLDVLVVPGGPGQTAAGVDPALLDFLRRQSAMASWTASVCTGALLLAAAGLLDGRRATTHWLAERELRRLGAIPCNERVVWDPPFVTSAGVSAGIDLALMLVERLWGAEQAQRIQLAMQYDPRPPFPAGSPHSAPRSVVDHLRAHSRFSQ